MTPLFSYLLAGLQERSEDWYGKKACTAKPSLTTYISEVNPDWPLPCTLVIYSCRQAFDSFATTAGAVLTMLYVKSEPPLMKIEYLTSYLHSLWPSVLSLVRTLDLNM